MKVIAFIIHGKIRRRNTFVTAANEVFMPHYKFLFYITAYKHHSIELAYEAAKDGAEYIVSVGGDGSLNEVVNGVMKAVDENVIPSSTKVKLGVLPHGTGNDFARTVGVTNSLTRLKELIDADSCNTIDIGRASYKSLQGKDTDRYFINITDIGIGGYIVKELANSSKFWGATITYQKAIFSNLLSYRNQQVKLTTGGKVVYEGEVKELAVANGRFVGGGLDIAPDAKIDDGLFSVVLAGKVSLFTYLRNIGNMRNHKKVEHSQVKYYTASEVLLESPVALPIDMDGEFVGHTPIKLVIVPKAICFIY